MARPRVPIEVRFAAKHTLDRVTGCWNWMSNFDKNGYGRLWVGNGASARAHRVSYRLHNGAIPRGKMVLHHCDNVRCVNPDHLYIGTAKDNAADTIKRGRRQDHRGENNPIAKLTVVKVRKIKQLRDKATQQAVADRFGVSRENVRDIWNGKVWLHVQ